MYTKMASLARAPVRAARRAVKYLWASTVQNGRFARAHRELREQRKIIYALTPPPYLQNVGDHAQAVAIHGWLKKQFPSLPVIEVDKDQCRYFLPGLRYLVGPGDAFFLHSGGNLGDRGIWSESRRRLLIRAFPRNRIVSLPQTIYFSDTPKGRREREKTRRIYAGHPDLTIIGRDLRSGELAAELFPKARTLSAPDFVLSMQPREPRPENDPPRVLLCLRDDTESALTPEERGQMRDRLGYESTYFDTTLPGRINVAERGVVLERTLDLFSASDAVVTDRYHGLIFAVLCRTPCVVLPTVDHKLTSAMDWFKEVRYVALARTLGEIPERVAESLAAESRETPDWNALYFDRLPRLIGAG